MIGSTATRPPPRREPGLAPMIDVVFLLLIFFMLVGQIQYSAAVRIQPPVSMSDTTSAQQQIELVIDMDGALYLEGQKIEPDTLPSVLQKNRQTEPPALLVKADADLPVAILYPVLKDLKDSGVLHAALATRLKPDAQR